MSREFRQTFLDHLVERGLTINEMIKVAELTADILEAGLEPVEKQANPAVMGASAGLADRALEFLTKRLGNTSDILVGGAVNAASNAAPLALMGSVALPIAAGYYGGNMLARVTDPGTDRLNEIKKREEIAELKTQTEILRQKRRLAQKTV